MILIWLTVLEAKAGLKIRLTDQNGRPIAQARIQIIPGQNNPDRETLPVSPPQPRTDGLIGFITDNNGRVSIDLPNGRYTVVASPRFDLSRDDQHAFLVMRTVDAPNNLTLSLTETTSVMMEAIGEGIFADDPAAPLEMAYVYFRPSKHAFGYVGLLDNDGQLKANISPGRYHIVIKGSIARHYLVLSNQEILPSDNDPSIRGQTILFDGRQTATAKLGFNLPEQTQLVLHEVLSSQSTYEYVDVIENQIGYDAAYTDVYALDSGQFVIPTRLLPNQAYQINLSYVMNLGGHLYAYEFRINDLSVDGPQIYTIGNDGSTPLQMTIATDRAVYNPGQAVELKFEISDQLGNQLYRFFNYSAARLVFPFVVIKDPDGRVIASNPITSEMPEDFFQFRFRLPPAAQVGTYLVEVRLDARYYGILKVRSTFKVIDPTDTAPPQIADLILPQVITNPQFETLNQLQFQARLADDTSVVANLTLQPAMANDSAANFFPASNHRPQVKEVASIDSPSQGELHIWIIPPNFLVGQKLKWSLWATDIFGNKTGKTGEIKTQLDPGFTPQSESFPGLSDSILILPHNTVVLAGQDRQFELVVTRGWVHPTAPEIDLIQQVEWTFDNRLLERQKFPLDPPSGQPDRKAAHTGEIILQGQQTGISRLSAKGTFPGTGDVFEVETTVRVIFGWLSQIQINPLNVTELRSGQRIRLKAIGYDTVGNQTEIVPTWTVSGGIGRIHQTRSMSLVDSDFSEQGHPRSRPEEVITVFVATQSGSGQVNAYLLDQTATLPITVTVGELHHLTVDPFIAYLPASNDQHQFQYQFVGHGWDIGHNPVSNLSIKWSLDQAAGTIDPTGLISSINQPNTQTLGNVIINGTIWADSPPSAQSGKSVVVIQNVPAQSMTHLSLSLKNFDQQLDQLTLAVGSQQKFEATGTDLNNQRITTTPLWVVSGQIGLIQPSGLFTATQAGTGKVVAIAEGLDAFMKIEVTHGLPRHIEVDPPYLTMIVGQQYQLIATTRDEFGYASAPVSSYRWWIADVNQDLARIDPQGRVTAILPGLAGVNVSTGDIIGQMQVFIRPADTGGTVPSTLSNQIPVEGQISIEDWHITPNQPLKVRAGESVRFLSYVQTGNPTTPIMAASPHWRIVSNASANSRHIGQIADNGLFRATAVGKGRILATLIPSTGSLPSYSLPADLAAKEVTIEVVADRPAFGRLQPGSAIIGTDPIWFQLQVFDTFGNLTKAAQKPIWKVIGTDGHISQTGRFFPKLDQPNLLDEHSVSAQVVAHIPALNIVARATVRRQPTDHRSVAQPNRIHRLRLAPSEAEISGWGETQFQFLAQDINGYQIEVIPKWRLESTQVLAPAIRLNDSGLLTIDSNLNPAESSQFQVVAMLDNGLQATATVYLMRSTLSRIEISAEKTIVSLQPNIPLKARLKLKIVGFDSAGNEMAIQPDWWVHPPLGRIDSSDQSDAYFVAESPGRCRVWVKQGYVTASWPVQILPPVQASHLKIKLLPQQMYVYPRHQSGVNIDSLERSENPTVIAGTEILVVALVKGSLTEPGQIPSLVTEQRVINARWQTDPTTRIRYLPDSVVGIRLTQVGPTNLFCQVDSPLPSASPQSGQLAVESRANLQIDVTPAAPARLQIKPEVISLRSDTDHPGPAQQFALYIFDRFGNSITAVTSSDELNLAWAVVGEIGTVSQNGVLKPAVVPVGSTAAGQVKVIAPYGQSQAEVSLVSDVGELASLEIATEAESITVGKQVRLIVRGRNQNGQLFPQADLFNLQSAMGEVFRFQVSDGGVKSVDDGWIFQAPTRLQEVRLQATLGEITSLPLQIQLLSDDPARLELNTGASTLPSTQPPLSPIGEQLHLTAGRQQTIGWQVTDQYENPLPVDDPRLTNDPLRLQSTRPTVGEVIIVRENLFSFNARQVGQTELVARIAGLQVSVTIEVTAGEIVELKLSPSRTEVVAGNSVTFHLMGLDAFDNRLSAADLPPVKVEASLVQDRSAQFPIGAEDKISEASSQIVKTFHATSPQSDIPTHAFTKTFSQSGLYQIVATTESHPDQVTSFNQLKATALVEVIPAALAKMQVILKRLTSQIGNEILAQNQTMVPLKVPYQLVSGASYQLEAIGQDTFGNAVEVQPTWKLIGDLGRIRQADVSGVIVEATFSGTGRLVASAGGISTRTTVTVVPFRQEIDATGGRLISPVGIQLDVPKGAFLSPVKIEVGIVESPGMNARAKRVTSAIEIAPQSRLSRRPLDLTFSYRSTITSDFDPQKLSLYFWDWFSERWVAIAGQVDISTQSVEATVNHFGTFTLMTTDQPVVKTTELAVQNIKLSPPLFFAPDTHQLTISYFIATPIDLQPDPLEVTMQVFDLYDQRVATLLDGSPRRAGQNAELWNGLNRKGQVVANGRYILLILIESGEEQVYGKKVITVFK